MADPLSIITTTTSVILTIVDSFQVVSAIFPLLVSKMTEFRDYQNSDNKKEIFKLLSELQKDTNVLSQVRKGYVGDREELDRPFRELIGYVTVDILH